MKMPVVLATSLFLALGLSACAHKKASSHRGGSGNAEDAEAADDEDDAEKPAKNPVVSPKSEPKEARPQTGAGDDQPAKEELCYKADADVCKIEQRILELMNKERAAPTKGGGFFGGGDRSAKAPLANGKKLAYVARLWSVSQGQRGSIGHDGFPNQRQGVYQQEFAGGAQIGGENVAMFGGSGGSVEDVAQQFYQMWYESSGHYQNMMGDFQAVGVGVVEVNGSWWATQIFGRE